MGCCVFLRFDVGYDEKDEKKDTLCGFWCRFGKRMCARRDR